MNLIEAIILGIVQGITEFAPISSSAHLVIVPHLFGWKQPLLFFFVVLHLGTLVAVTCYFRSELSQLLLAFINSVKTQSVEDDPFARLAWFIILGTIPAAVLGYLFNDFFEALFESPYAVSCSLLITGLVMILSERLGRQKRNMNKINLSDSMVIGIAQALAITPGISRSGITISAGLLKGLKRESAARFSFLLSFPIILGVFIQELIKVGFKIKAIDIIPLLVGFLASAASGYLCIKYLLRYLQNRKLTVFAYYCFVLGILTIILNWLVF